MIKFFKKLFCKHDYKVYQDHSDYNGVNDKTPTFKKRCTKCGRIKTIK